MPDFIALGQRIPAGAFSEYDMEAIYPALDAMSPNDVYLEVGVDRGRSLAYARTISKGWVYGIDKGHEIDLEWFRGKQKWKFIHAESDKAVKHWVKPIDVLFIDGDHTYEGVKSDWENFSPFIKRGGIAYFHDCDETSPGVVKLFKEIGWPDKTFWIKELDGRKTSMASVRKK